MTKKTLFKFIYVSFFIAAALVVLSTPPYIINRIRLGQIFGALALTGLSLQLIMTSRIRFLERGLGYDRILSAHSVNAKLSFAFLVLHPIFLLQDFTLLKTFSFYHYLGVVALLLLILNIILTVYQPRLGLNYEHWKLIHKSGYVIISLGFIHSFFVGTDILLRSRLFYWWLFLLILVIFSLLYRHVYRRLVLTRSVYQVSKIVPEAPHIRSIHFHALNGKVFPFSPGQFAFIRFLSPHLSREEHHFTISSAPNEKFLSMTIKESGDFTSTLGKLKIGDKAIIEGPFGVFTNVNLSGPFVFVAGGIGITPLISMLRAMSAANQKDKVILFYSVKTPKDLVFHQELENLKKQRWLTVYYFFTEGGSRPTIEFIKKRVKNLKKCKIFICGPAPMLASFEADFQKFIGNPANIYSEKFALK